MNFPTFRFGGFAPLIAVTAALLLAGTLVPAKAGSIAPGALCPNTAGLLNGDFGITYSHGPLDDFCGNPLNGSAVTITLTDESQYNGLDFPLASYAEFPIPTTLSNMLTTTLEARVNNTGAYLPYFQLAFLDSFPGGVFDAGSLLDFREVPTSTVSGGYMNFDPLVTEFYLYDDNTSSSKYGILASGAAHTLSDWLTLYPNLSGEGLSQLIVGFGNTGSSSTTAGVTLNALYVGPIPEPATPFLIGLGLVALGLIRKRRHS